MAYRPLMHIMLGDHALRPLQQVIYYCVVYLLTLLLQLLHSSHGGPRSAPRYSRYLYIVVLRICVNILHIQGLAY